LTVTVDAVFLRDMETGSIFVAKGDRIELGQYEDDTYGYFRLAFNPAVTGDPMTHIDRDAGNLNIAQTGVARRAYLAIATGDLYIDGSYYTFSPKLDKHPLEIVKEELKKPDAPRDVDGRHICPIDGNALDFEYDADHWREYSKRYAKDVGKLALATASLILELYESIEKLERRVKELEARQGGGLIEG